MRGSSYENMKTKRMIFFFFLDVKGRKGPILSEVQNKPRDFLDFSGTTVKSIFYNVNVPNLFQFSKHNI